ncbi:MAG: glycosyltransferase family 4 protein [Candidatus Aminicenantales bacterium]
MKIGYLTQWFQPEPNPRGLSLAKELQNRGHTVKVLTAFPNYPYGKLYPGYKLSLRKREDIDGIKITRVALYPYKGSVSLLRLANYLSFGMAALLFGLYEFRDVDVILTYDAPPSYIIPILVFKNILKKKIVLDIQDLWPENLKATNTFDSPSLLSFIEKICNYMFKIADRVIVISPGFKDRLIKRGVTSSKISVVYNWTDQEELYVKVDDLAAVDKEDNIFMKVVNEETSVFIYAGNLGKAQGLSKLVEVASQLKTDGVKLAMIGDGLERKFLINYAEKVGATNVFFMGRKSPGILSRLLKAADGLVVYLKNDPNLQMTIPSKTQSYMASGKPIIMIHNGEASRLIENAECGLVCEAEEVPQMLSIFKKFISLDKKEREKMGTNAKNYYLKNLSRSVGTKRIEEILMSV